ncbi:NAD(P)/FAD-dependent oxidoreductase [Ornithinibacter aureus]|uniref:NAD(P)/FAD-dependent oxidoreductase n=1 Tax=Ornithinibacter aureus TaxID=622664 RepID=A0ABP8K9Z3_9MICO|nr:NAD(P)/FAD-dependent oxidoreductase [Ornithinibacter aureus]KAF0834228.1 cation diffusion facilitator CzcD-associated flavoprotein CzcO [Ornithinibacter aureus]
MSAAQVVVIGAGPGGLAAAAALGARGVQALVVDRDSQVGSSWRRHYERLHLHTPRRWSGLPGYPIPRRFGRWVARADVVRYLEEYVEHHGILLRLGTAVTRIERASTAASHRNGATAGDSTASDSVTNARWLVHLDDGPPLAAEHVIVATGYNHTPVTPDWPGLDGFTGDLVLARDYRNGRPYAGRDVLVVGTGNTGTEIATDLAEHGATRVWLAVRTPPHIIRRDMLGWPAQGTGILVRRLPPRLVDRVAHGLAAVQEPDLSAYGMPRADPGLYSRVLVGRVPVQDVGIVDAIRTRRVEPVAAVESVDGAEVVLTDGTRLRPDAVLVAAGYRAGLEPLVGDLGVLDGRGLPVVHGAHEPPGAPGLWFTGFTNPISGMLRELRIDAERIAAAIAR